ncbi:hypothetical protein ACTXT7_006347 [Hymenolepis weldensis]
MNDTYDITNFHFILMELDMRALEVKGKFPEETELLYNDVDGKTVPLGIIKLDKMIEHTRLCLRRFLNFVIFNRPSAIPREFDHFLENLTTSSQALKIKMCGWIKFVNYFLLIAIKNNWIKDEELIIDRIRGAAHCVSGSLPN